MYLVKTEYSLRMVSMILIYINNFDNAETFVKIERDYIKVSDEDKSFVKNLLFEPVFNNNVDEALLFFARALSGQVQDKVWSIILGSRDAGKGVIQDAIKTAFKGYIATINADTLIFDKNSGDAAKKLSWAFNFDKTRLAFSNEMKLDKGMKLDGNLIKKVCSGGDTIQLRKNHVDEKDIHTQTTLMLFCNDCLQIDPVDTYEKLIPFSLKNRFVDVPITEELLKENPYYRKSDPDIREKVNNDERIINAVADLIISSFKPNKVVLNEEMINMVEAYNSEVSILDILNEDFEITRNEKDRLDNAIMKDYIKFSNINVSLPKVTNLYMSKGVQNKKARIDNIPRTCFIGSRRIHKESPNNEVEINPLDV